MSNLSFKNFDASLHQQLKIAAIRANHSIREELELRLASTFKNEHKLAGGK